MMQFMGAGGPDTHRYQIMGSFKSMQSGPQGHDPHGKAATSRNALAPN